MKEKARKLAGLLYNLLGPESCLYGIWTTCALAWGAVTADVILVCVMEGIPLLPALRFVGLTVAGSAASMLFIAALVVLMAVTS